MKEYSYQELVRIGQKYYKDARFCSVIAIATACNQAFGKAYHTMKRQGRPHAKGAQMFEILGALKELGFNANRVSGFEGKQVKSMPSLLPKTGSYMVFIRGHVLTVKNGEVCDWTEGRAHRVVSVYKIERV